jgi:phage FluMu protein Com
MKKNGHRSVYNKLKKESVQMETPINEIRCKECGKKLGEIHGNITRLFAETVDNIQSTKNIDKDSTVIQIKCYNRKCKVMNEVVV